MHCQRWQDQHWALPEWLRRKRRAHPRSGSEVCQHEPPSRSNLHTTTNQFSLAFGKEAESTMTLDWCMRGRHAGSCIGVNPRVRCDKHVTNKLVLHPTSTSLWSCSLISRLTRVRGDKHVKTNLYKAQAHATLSTRPRRSNSRVSFFPEPVPLRAGQ